MLKCTYFSLFMDIFWTCFLSSQKHEMARFGKVLFFPLKLVCRVEINMQFMQNKPYYNIAVTLVCLLVPTFSQTLGDL